MKTSSFVEYSLGLEELALAFGLINRKDLGQQLIKSTYPDLTPKQVDDRLSAASHSLIARGLTSITPSGTPQMDATFEKALFPMAVFDHLFQLSLVIGKGQAYVTIHVQKGKIFTAHLVKAGVVHVITHGPIDQLRKYVSDVFDEIGTEIHNKSTKIDRKISLGILGQLQAKDVDTNAIRAKLINVGWNESEAMTLCQDFSEQKFRGTLLRMDGGQDTKLENIRTMQNKNMLFLKGEQNSWMFEFSDTQDTAEGSARIVDRTSFEKSLNEFIS